MAVGVSGEAGDDVWLYDLNRGVMSPLSRGAQMAVWPTWTPDGRRVLFGGFVGGRTWSVHSVSATETSAPQRILAQVDEPQWPCSISPDGKWLLYAQMSGGGDDIWIAPLDRPSEAKPLMVTPAREQEAHFSPDGRWIAYISDESGRYELYVRRFPVGTDRVQVSTGGAVSVSWSSAGRELAVPRRRRGDVCAALREGRPARAIAAAAALLDLGSRTEPVVRRGPRCAALPVYARDRERPRQCDPPLGKRVREVAIS